MPLGPVFQAELLTTSRRRRYYLARVGYGLTLLALIGWTYEGMRRHREAATASAGVAPSFAFLAETAEAIFSTFILVQINAVLWVTPTMVAGSVAEERQRKTLLHLLASRLGSLEIVGGKMVARMLQVIVLVAAGLPIMSLLSLFGGLDPPLVVAAFAGTVSTAVFVGGISILASTLARRARDAIIAVYLIEAAWLAGPYLVASVLETAAPSALAVLGPIRRVVDGMDPYKLAEIIRPTPGLASRLVRMAAVQTVAALGLVLFAAWRLRPSSAGPARGRRARQVGDDGPRVGFLARPPIGDDPMLWKERHVSRIGPVLRVLGLMAGVFALVFLGDALLDLGRVALAEVLKYGYGDGGEGHRGRDSLNGFVATAAMAAYLVWLPGVATTAAASISSEREEDTWTSLLGTSLTAGEILKAKAIGALWRWRFVGLTCLGLWTIGLVLGAIHPLAYGLTVALFATFTAFAVVLGLRLSLMARSTTRAMTGTMIVLFLLNGGYLMCLFPLAGSGEGTWYAPCTPVALLLAPERYAVVQYLFGGARFEPSLRLDQIVTRLTTCLASLVLYGVATIALGVMAVDAFHRAADRPRRPRRRGVSTESTSD